MFLSKIFGIFKRKNKSETANNSTDNKSSFGATVPPTGTIGTAVGLTQTDQSVVTPPTEQVAQAPIPDQNPPADEGSSPMQDVSPPTSPPAPDNLPPTPVSNDAFGGQSDDSSSPQPSAPETDENDTTNQNPELSEPPAPEPIPETPPSTDTPPDTTSDPNLNA